MWLWTKKPKPAAFPAAGHGCHPLRHKEVGRPLALRLLPQQPATDERLPCVLTCGSRCPKPVHMQKSLLFYKLGQASLAAPQGNQRAMVGAKLTRLAHGNVRAASFLRANAKKRAAALLKVGELQREARLAHGP